ncbi:MAG: hypothetical protein HY505_01645 [Candidatus Yanofskybacteria bacterium]|nr:hypothetical protein [Candidatus Yanofskybacteria bacterium]
MKNDNVKFKIFVISLVLLSTFYFLLSNSVSADEPGDSNFTYLFHLYYDNGQLFVDRDFEFKYDVVPEEFVSEVYNTQFPFKGEIINLKNEVSTDFLFDPRQGNPDFLKGKISVKAPYVPDAQKVVFYDAQDKSLLTIFVSESSFCNDDGVCNDDRGEDYLTCSNDCRGVVAPPSPEQETGGQGGMLMSAIYVLIILGVGVGGWYGWKWWKGRQTPPPIQFPQNPNVQ